MLGDEGERTWRFDRSGCPAPAKRRSRDRTGHCEAACNCELSNLASHVRTFDAPRARLEPEFSSIVLRAHPSRLAGCGNSQGLEQSRDVLEDDLLVLEQAGGNTEAR